MEASVLYVDDDEANLTVFEAAFAGEMMIGIAKSADEALQYLSHREVSVLISDQRMPGVSGVELLEKVHQQWPDTIRILVTAYSDLNAAIAAINQGHVNRYLRKPWVPDELRAILMESIGLYETHLRMRAMQQRLVETERWYALGLVASGLAQELRPPVTWVSDLLRKAQDDVREAVQLNERTDVPRTSLVDRLNDVDGAISDSLVGVQRLLDVVKGVETPSREDSTERADVGEIIRLTLKILRREMQQAGQVRIDVRSVPQVKAPSSKISQVALNLLTHAAQHLAKHKSSNGVITLRLYQKEKNVVLEVSDNGPSLPEAVLARIFDPLYIAKDDYGLGLGLAISKTIAEELGGTLEVENLTEGGCLFRFSAPAI